MLQIQQILRIAFLLSTLLFILSQGKIIQVPPISIDQSLSLRLQQNARIEVSFNQFGNLTKIYKKQIYQIIDGKQVNFPICQQQPPQTSFLGHASIGIQSYASPNGLVYAFQQVKYPRNLIDIANVNNKVYYMLQNGNIKINSISADYRSIKEQKTYNTGVNKVSTGNFIILASIGYGIFINQNQGQIFNLADDSFTSINQFETRMNYESAIALDDKYFAVAYGELGIRIYSLNIKDKTINIQGQLNKDNSNLLSINIKDLSYDKKRKILFLADYYSGVLSLQLSYGAILTTKLTSSAISNKLCNLIYYDSFNDQLYLNCRELHKYRINNWPIIDQKILPKQQISIRQIISTESVVALVGRNIFEIIVADRKATTYQDKLLDKLILNGKYFISANQNGILIGEYRIVLPSIKCFPVQKASVGNHRVVMRIFAECNKKYLDSVAFYPENLAENDKCVYSVYQNMSIWQPAIINATPFMAIGAIIGIIGLIILIWWAFSYLSFRRLRNYFDNYHNLQQQNNKATDRNQQKVQNPQASGGTNEKMVMQNKKQEIEMKSEQLHDIQ